MDHVQAVPNEMRRSTEKESVFQHTVALRREFHCILLFMIFNLKLLAIYTHPLVFYMEVNKKLLANDKILTSWKT